MLLGCWVSEERRGFALGIDEHGALSFKLGDGEVQRLSSETPLRERQWYWVGASFDAETSRASMALVSSSIQPRPMATPTPVSAPSV